MRGGGNYGSGGGWWEMVGTMGGVGTMGAVGAVRAVGAVGGVGMVPRFVGGESSQRGSDVRTAWAVCGDYGKCELQRWSYKKLCQRRSR